MPNQVKLKPSYVKGKKPVKDKFGRNLFVHAPQLTYEFSSKLWKQKNTEINRQINNPKTQIVVLTSHQNDVAHVIYKNLKHHPLGKYSVATTIEQEFPDGELKILIDGEAPKAELVYIIASILNERDFSRVRKVADHYKNTLNAKFITLICPYLGATREDKNVTTKGEYEPCVTSIRAEIGGLSPYIDKMIIVEPHSFATQACAASFGIPLVPISPWKLMAEQMQKRYKINPENYLVVRPDKGRNLAAVRIGEYLNLPSVSFDKVRVSGQAVTLFELSDEEKKLVKGKTCIIYDDEASTMGTIFALAEALQGYGAKSMIVCLVHCKFTSGWETKIKHPLFSLVLGTDSRQPIGNINISDNIEIVSLGGLIIELIKADIKGVNFWTDKDFKEMILQE
jgi:phosphoribosylpyrophosphate synthetase